VRLFIAIKLEKACRDYLKDRISILQENINQDLKWVKTENLHITMKFLGELPVSKKALLENSIDNLTKNSEQREASFQGLGAFPKINYPKTLFVRIGKGSDFLKGLYNSLEENLTNRGFKPDKRKYTPHLTIARSSRKTDIKGLSADLNSFTGNDFINIEMPVKRICLMQSILKRTGPEYREIYSCTLKER